MLEIKRFYTSVMATNCYFVKDILSGEIAVIDPGGSSDLLFDEIEKNGGKIKYILLTHGHFDHIGFVSELKKKYKPEIGINIADSQYTIDNRLNLSEEFDLITEPFKCDFYLEEGKNFYLGKTGFSVLSTPGHTDGSVCILADDIMFSGDTLFKGSIGRTDFLGGSFKKMQKSLQKLSMLEKDYKVFPGHGEKTLLSYEKSTNPYLL